MIDVWTVTWVVKVSKRCGLRCRYCYEWDNLARPERFSLDQWTSTLQAVAGIHAREVARTGQPGRSYIAWHGGEPLLLPVGYAHAVLAAERDILGVQSLRNRTYANAVQTSLHALSDAWLDTLVEGRFEVGVSFDLVPGVRLTAGGGGTERRVLANLDRLQAREVTAMGAVVLASHTEHELEEIHDFYAGRGLPLQVNLLVPSPVVREGSSLVLPWNRAAAALERLFLHWMDTGCRVEVQPLAGYLAAVLLRRMGLEQHPLPGEPWTGRLTVDTGGDVYRAWDYGVPEHALGNLFTTPCESLLSAESGEQAIARARERRGRHCHRCSYRRVCDGSPVLEASRPYAPGPCPVAAQVMTFIDRCLESSGFRDADARRAVARLPGLQLPTLGGNAA